MGIPRFYNLLSNADLKKIASAFHIDWTAEKKILDATHYAIDCNAVVHPTSKEVLDVINANRASAFAAAAKGDPLPEAASKFHTKMGMKPPVGNLPGVIEYYEKFFTNEKLDEIISRAVKQVIIWKMNTFMNPTTLRKVYIALDGVCSKAKMKEQRTRRYNGSVVSEYSKKLWLDVFRTNAGEELKTQVEHSISWNTTRITPGTIFMKTLANELRTLSNAKNTEPDFRFTGAKFYVSDTTEVGEGEKKIIMWLSGQKFRTSDITLFDSPDADVIVLEQLRIAKSEGNVVKSYILRHDSQLSLPNKPIYGLIAIHDYREAIYEIIQQECKHQLQLELVNFDVGFWTVVFGNDFVPNLETVSSDRDISYLLQAYVDTLNSYDEPKYMVRFDDKGKYRLSLTVLRDFCKRLLVIENRYLASGPLSHTIGKMNAATIYNFFQLPANTSAQDARGIAMDYQQWYNSMAYDIANGKDASRALARADYMKILPSAMGTDMHIPKGSTSEEIQEMIRAYAHKKKAETGRTMIPRLKYAVRAPPKKENTASFRAKLETIDDPYNRELLYFNNLAGPYEIVLNVGEYLWGEGSVAKYYENNFGANLHDKLGNVSAEVKEICHKYTDGLLWTFDYYMNGDEFPNWWYYKYEHPPLLKHLVSFLDSLSRSQFLKMHDELDDYRAKSLDKFFHPVEQYMYVCPMTESNILNLPKEYRAFLISERGQKFIQTWYPDMEDYANDILAARYPQPKPARYFSCVDVRYLSKCQITNNHFRSKEDDIAFIMTLRKEIKERESTKEINASVRPNYDF